MTFIQAMHQAINSSGDIAWGLLIMVIFCATFIAIVGLFIFSGAAIVEKEPINSCLALLAALFVTFIFITCIVFFQGNKVDVFKWQNVKTFYSQKPKLEHE